MLQRIDYLEKDLPFFTWGHAILRGEGGRVLKEAPLPARRAQSDLLLGSQAKKEKRGEER